MEEIRPRVLVGREMGDHLAIRVLGRMHPGADDFWDGNWLVTPLDLVVGDFHGTVSAALRVEELEALHEQLVRVHESLSGNAELVSMEGWLHLSIAVAPSGALEVSGRARDRLGRGNELAFHVDGLDQSDLPEVIEALDEIRVFYPIVGRP